MQPSRKLLSITVGAAIFVGIAIPVLAFSHPLSSTAIRDAYFLGAQNDERTAEFLAQYARRLPAPKTGPYVNEIGIDTPFTQIVRHALTTANYAAPDAVKEFQDKPMSVCVHVDIGFTPGYSPVPETSAPALYQWVPDFWNDFKVRLIQGNHAIPEQRRVGGPFYFYGDGGTPLIVGAHIELRYDAEQIDADSTTIEVRTPNGQTVESTFDLARLR